MREVVLLILEYWWCLAFNFNFNSIERNTADIQPPLWYTKQHFSNQAVFLRKPPHSRLLFHGVKHKVTCTRNNSLYIKRKTLFLRNKFSKLGSLSSLSNCISYSLSLFHFQVKFLSYLQLFTLCTPYITNKTSLSNR